MMALLNGTNPECDAKSVPMVRWVVERVRRGLFRRERIEVSVERLVTTQFGDGWITLDPRRGEFPTPEEQESLVALTIHDWGAEVVLAKLRYLVLLKPKSVGFVVDTLRGRLHEANVDRETLEATIESMHILTDAAFAARKRIEQERDDAQAEVAVLRAQLMLADNSVRDCVAKGYRATTIRSADGESIERGDNAFLGSDPERRLILIDCAEAICAENLRVVGLPEGVPAMPTDSPGGTGDGAGTAAGEADLLSFLGVQP